MRRASIAENRMSSLPLFISLSEVLTALRRLGLKGWTVVWDPGGLTEERGA